MSSHPGSTLKEAVALAEYLRDLGYMPEQVQDFYPTPSTISTCMYYTGLDPRTMKPVYVPKTPHEKAMQRALIQYRNPKNYELVREALLKAGRGELIGFDKKCLIRPRQTAAGRGRAEGKSSRGTGTEERAGRAEKKGGSRTETQSAGKGKKNGMGRAGKQSATGMEKKSAGRTGRQGIIDGAGAAKGSPERGTQGIIPGGGRRDKGTGSFRGGSTAGTAEKQGGRIGGGKARARKEKAAGETKGRKNGRTRKK